MKDIEYDNDEHQRYWVVDGIKFPFPYNATSEEEEEAKKIAKQFAASEDLLEACKKVLHVLIRAEGEKSVAVNRIKQAIKKAES